MEIGLNIFAIIGFLFAAYAVVGNDALQTLGTFINSNNRIHWFWLFLFAAVILVVTFTYGWVINDGDPSWGRLANAKKYPAVVIEWYHILPPLALLIITRLGIPVSTSFMVLTVFATVGGMTSMLSKSLIGYGLAFVVGGIIYLIATNTIEKYFSRTKDQQYALHWVIIQWCTTAYLWSVWLIQDFANIFVFLPRNLTGTQSFLAMFAIVALLAYTFWNKGGPVQRILRSKTAVTDIRSASIIDFTYGCILFYFKELNNIPMSTTLVFLGLMAGREYAFAFMTRDSSKAKAVRESLNDAAKAYIGLALSINMALLLPFIARAMTEDGVGLGDLLGQPGVGMFLLIGNLLLLPVAYYLNKKDKVASIALVASFAVALGLFFGFPITA